MSLLLRIDPGNLPHDTSQLTLFGQSRLRGSKETIKCKVLIPDSQGPAKNWGSSVIAGRGETGRGIGQTSKSSGCKWVQEAPEEPSHAMAGKG